MEKSKENGGSYFFGSGSSAGKDNKGDFTTPYHSKGADGGVHAEKASIDIKKNYKRKKLL